MRSLSILGLCAMVVFSAGTPRTSAQMERPYDSSFIAPDAFMVVFARPAKLMAQMEKNAFMDEMFSSLENDVGLDVNKIEQFQLSFGDGSGGNFDSDQIAIIIHYAEDLPMDSIVAGEWGSSEEIEFQGRPMFPPTSEHQPGVYFPNDRTMVVAERERLELVAGTPMTMSSIVERVRDLDHEAEFAILYDGEQVDDELLSEMFREFPPMGEFSIQELATQVKEFQLVGNSKNMVSVQGTMVTEDEESATRIKTVIQGALELGRMQLPVLKKQMTQDLDFMPVEFQEMAKTSFEGMEAIVEGTTVSNEGNNVNIGIAVDGGIGKILMSTNALFMAAPIRAAEPLIEEDFDRIEIKPPALEEEIMRDYLERGRKPDGRDRGDR